MPIPPIIPPMLAAADLRVDDAARAIRPDDTPHARLPEIRIDGNLREDGTESMHRETLACITRLHLRERLDRCADTANCLDEIIGAAARERVLARLAARRLNSAADACHRHRAAMHGRPRHPGVAETEIHPLN